MQLTGSLPVDAGRAEVWAVLTDAEGLRSCGRAIESIEVLPPDRGRVTVKVGSGFFAIKATVDVRLVELVVGERATLEARGAAAGTELAASGRVSLSGPPEGPTTIDYVADIELSGGFAGMAEGMLRRDGRQMLLDTFECVRARAAARG